MKETILKRYEVRQDITKIQAKLKEFIAAEKVLDDIITYKALLLDDPQEANRFKKLHLDSRKEGIFKLKVKDSLKITVPNY